jgi:hypothetical protein
MNIAELTTTAAGVVARIDQDTCSLPNHSILDNDGLCLTNVTVCEIFTLLEKK